jgi:uncharacterized membrane protein YeaQ/YmgE (transglycosylase-associated protein family)
MYKITGIEPLKKKIFSAKMIMVAAFLGGPLVGAYLIGKNFRVFNEPSRARRTLIYSVIGTVILFGLFFSIPDRNQIPPVLFPLICAVIAQNIVKSYQGYRIQCYLSEGGEVNTWWRVLVVTVIGAVLTLILLLAIAVFSRIVFSILGSHHNQSSSEGVVV